MGDVIELSKARAARLLPAWRAMVPEDLAAVAEVSLACGGAGPLPSPGRIAGCIVLESRGLVVGHLTIEAGRHAVRVVDLCLLPEFRGLGHASLAVGMAASWCAAAGHHVIEVVAPRGSDGFWSRSRFASVAGPDEGGTTRMARLLPAPVAASRRSRHEAAQVGL